MPLVQQCTLNEILGIQLIYKNAKFFLIVRISMYFVFWKEVTVLKCILMLLVVRLHFCLNVVMVPVTVNLFVILLECFLLEWPMCADNITVPASLWSLVQWTTLASLKQHSLTSRHYMLHPWLLIMNQVMQSIFSTMSDNSLFKLVQIHSCQSTIYGKVLCCWNTVSR